MKDYNNYKEQGGQDHEEQQTQQDVQNQSIGHDDILGTRIAHVLHERAERVQFTPELHQRIMQRLSSRSQPRNKYLRMPVAALVASLILILALALYAFSSFHTSHLVTRNSAIHYITGATVTTPTQLAQQGQLISLDPTGHSIVYEPNNQPGVMYTTNLQHPLTDNVLAMREARDVAWSPDGSALVITIAPSSTSQPLLALVPTGKYMHLLGQEAFAASWLPTNNQEITYVTQVHGQTQLWAITPQGQAAHLLTTINISTQVQHLIWSPNGHKLVLLATNRTVSSPQTLAGPTQALYVLNMPTQAVQQVAIPVGATIGNLTWSPDSRMLTYAQSDIQNHSSLHTIDAATLHSLFTMTITQPLQGWSWSPHSDTLLYSDGGTLHTHTIHGNAVMLPAIKGHAISPFWLPNGHILYMQVSNGIGQLAWLIPNQNHQ